MHFNKPGNTLKLSFILIGIRIRTPNVYNIFLGKTRCQNAHHKTNSLLLHIILYKTQNNFKSDIMRCRKKVRSTSWAKNYFSLIGGQTIATKQILYHSISLLYQTLNFHNWDFVLCLTDFRILSDLNSP